MRKISILAARAGCLFCFLLAAPLLEAQQFPQGTGEERNVPPVRDLYKAPGPNLPTSKEEVLLYAPVEDQIIGRISIPDAKLATLVQPEGRTWRTFRTVYLAWGAAAVLLGTLAVLAVFYLWRGRIRIEQGRSDRFILRFNAFERFTHWLTAVSFIVLALTGLLVTFGRPLLIPLIGHSAFTTISQAAKYAHNFTSVPFVLGLVVMAIVWIRDNLPEKADLEWFKQAGGIFKTHSSHPETGRFNAGQKLVFWSVILGGLGLTVSGYLLMVPFAVTGVSGMQIAHAVHAVLAVLMIAAIFGHIYIGTIGMEGAFAAMGRGRVDENWALEHHRGWYGAIKRRPAEPNARPLARSSGAD
jgi:formate dehydrogenase subunit gamma